MTEAFNRLVCIVACVLFTAADLRAEPPQSKTCQVTVHEGSRRVAFVVGNGKYTNGIPELRNPPNDARALTAVLKSLRFSVVTSVDVNSQTVKDCATTARKLVAKPEVMLFHFSGHGVQIRDRNYLVGVDARLDRRKPNGLVELAPLIAEFQSTADATLVFLDACRDNPFESATGRGLSGASIRSIQLTNGATTARAKVTEQVRGLLIAFATAPDTAALDGDGKNSPFTAALLRNLRLRGHSIQRIMSAVTRSVGEATNWVQTPWIRSSLSSELKLRGDITLDQSLVQSENHARRAGELLGQGERQLAIASALKGLPASPSDDDFTDFYHAHLALFTAIRNRSAKLPIRDSVSSHLWSDDGSVVAVGTHGADGHPAIQIWNVATRQQKMVLRHPGLTTGIYRSLYNRDLALSYDGKFVARAEMKGKISIWEVENKKRIASYAAAKSIVYGHTSEPQFSRIEFSPSGRYLLSIGGSRDKLKIFDLKVKKVKFVLFDTKIGRLTGFRYPSAGPGPRVAGSFANDGNICVAMQGRPGVRAGLLRLVSNTFEEYGREVLTNEPIDVQCSSDGSALSVLYRSKKDANLLPLRVWRRNHASPWIKISNTGEQVGTSFSPNGKYYVIHDNLGRRFYELESGRKISQPFVPSGYGEDHQLLFNAEGHPAGYDIELPTGIMWRQTPQKSALVKFARSLLSDRQLAEVERDRIRFSE